jgi:hypothetical protein
VGAWQKWVRELSLPAAQAKPNTIGTALRDRRLGHNNELTRLKPTRINFFRGRVSRLWCLLRDFSLEI